MGADGASTSGDRGARVSSRSKVHQLGEFLIGTSGTLMIGQVLELRFDPPAIDNDEVYAYMVKRFAPALRELIKGYGGEIKTQSGNEEMDGRVIVGVRGRIFVVDTGYGVLEMGTSFCAIGCADQEALAAMFTAKRINPNFTAAEIVGYGLAAAEEFDLAIRGPFTILSTPKVERALAAVS